MNNITNIWLKLFSVISLLGIIFVWSAILISNYQYSDNGVGASFCSALCITNIVGIIYVSRNLRFGIFVLLIAHIILGLVSFLLMGDVPIFMYISFTLSLITFSLLFSKKENATIWSQMKDGMDITHFKHIYQLASLFFIAFIIIGGYLYYANRTPKSNLNLDDNSKINKIAQGYISEDDIIELDKVTITLGKISAIEKNANNLSLQYKSRIMALKHLLAGHIVTSNHDIDAFKMAYSLRKPDLSTEQQDVLDWFFKQDSRMLDIWSKSKDGANSIGELRQRMEAIIKQHGK